MTKLRVTAGTLPLPVAQKIGVMVETIALRVTHLKNSDTPG